MIKVMRYFLIFFAFVFISCSNDDDVIGSGILISENRALSTFTRISNNSSINVTVKQGDNQTLQVTADDNIMHLVKTDVKNGTLHVDLPRRNYDDITILITVTILRLNEIKNNSSGNIDISEIVGQPNLKIENRGSGSVTVRGTCNFLDLINTGTGSHYGFGFIVQNVEVKNTSSGTCEIHCINTLIGSNSGSGSILYKGNPEFDVSNSGTGKVSRLD